MICAVCRDFGQVHPVLATGQTDYSRTIFCKCQGARAGGEASPAITTPDIDNDIFAPVEPDYYKSERDARERRSYLATIKEEPSDAPEPPCSPINNNGDGLMPIRVELNHIKNRLNEHLDATKKFQRGRL